MQYETIFFDLDHTLWDFKTNAREVLTELAFKYKLQEKGVSSLHHFINEYFEINDRMWEDYRKGIISQDTLRKDRFHIALKRYEIEDVELATAMGKDYVNIAPLKTNLIPFTIEVLEYLNKKYSLHIITNGFEDVQHLKLKTCKLNHYFSEVITSERSGFKKPDPGIFHYSLNIAKAKPENSLMVGDSLDVDVQGAKSVGMNQVYFNPDGISHSEDLTHEIKCLSELIKIL